MKKHLFLKSLLIAIGLLIASINTAWADHKYWFAGDNPGWSTDDYPMNVSADGYYEYYQVSGSARSNYNCKIITAKGSWDGALGNGNTDSGFNGTNITNMNSSSDSWSTDNFRIWCTSATTFYILAYYPNTTINSSSSVKLCAATFLPDNRSCTTYFVDSQDWGGTLKAYEWYSGNGDGSDVNNAAWAGANMTSTGYTYNGKTIYKYTHASKTFQNVIFTNKTGGSSQTADLVLYDQTVPTDNRGKMYVNTASSPAWAALQYDVALDRQSGTTGDQSVIATVGSAMPSATMPTRTGYTFGGYYTSTGGSGTKYYNADGSSADTMAADGPKKLYAKWTENMSTVTLTASPSSKGTFTVGSTPNQTSTTAGVTTTRSVTAVPISGYHFVSWDITGGASISSTTTNPTTVTGGGAGTAATLTATFAADDVYTLTVAAGTGVSSVTGTTNNIKAGNNIAISATVAAGYTWNTWTKTGAGTLSSFTAGTKDQTVTIGTAGDITLTASATEDKVTLVPTVSYDHGSSNYTATSANQVGVSTTTVLTASAPNAAHYTFAGWTLTNLTVTSGNAASDLSITVKVTDPASECSAVANYNEVLTQSTWVLKGGTAIAGSDDWGTEYALSKKTGHSTEDIVYYTLTNVPVTPDGAQTTYNFKIVQKGGSDTYWGLHTDNDASDYWYTRSTGEQTMTSAGGDHNNIQLRADVAGNYEIKVDYTTPASPKVTVTFPTSYTLTYDIGTVKGNYGSVSTSPSTASGSRVLGGTNVTLTAPEPAPGYSWKGWYANAAGTEGKIADDDRAITVMMDADKTLYACYTENSNTVTVNVNGCGKISYNSGAASTSVNASAGVNTFSATISTIPDPGYAFVGWTGVNADNHITNYANVGGDGGWNSTNEGFDIKVKADAATTITANFQPRFALMGSLTTGDANTGGMPGWSTPAYATYSDGTYTVSCDLTNPNSTYKFKIIDLRHKSWVYRGYSTGENNLAVDNTTTYTLNSETSDVYFDSRGIGTYKFTIVGETIEEVVYPTVKIQDGANSHRITWGYVSDNGQEGGTITSVVDGEATPNAIASGKYVKDGGSITATAEEKSGYRFIDFRTSSTYGGGSQLSTTNPYTVASVTADQNIYAQFAENLCTVTITANDKTKGSIVVGGEDFAWDGTVNVGVYNYKSLAVTPVAGYYFAGWTLSTSPDFSVDDAGESGASTNLTGLGGIHGSTGTLTANFQPLDTIYFKNTLSWAKVFVYFNPSWDYAETPSSSKGVYPIGAEYTEMTNIGDNIYRALIPRSFTRNNYTKVAFSDVDMSGYTNFNGNNAVYRDDWDYNTKTLDMYIPCVNTNDGATRRGTNQLVFNGTTYYNHGYWVKKDVKINDGMGYYIKNSSSLDKQFTAIADDEHTGKVTVRVDNLSNQTYYICSAGGREYSNTGITFTSGGGDNQTLYIYNSRGYFTVTPSAEGDYTFYLYQDGDHMSINVSYPVSPGDYRIRHSYTDGGTKYSYSDIIKKGTTSDKVSMYIRNTSGTLKIAKCSGLDANKKPLWTDGIGVTGYTAANFPSAGVYVFDVAIVDDKLENPEKEVTSATISNVAPYTGDFYIKTDCAPGGWTSYKSNILDKNTVNFNESDASTFDYYHCNWAPSNTNVKCVIANDYNIQLTDTLKTDAILLACSPDATNHQSIPQNTSIRFSYNSKTNELKRAYLASVSGTDVSNVKIKPSTSEYVYQKDAATDLFSGANLKEAGNWTYQIDVDVYPGDDSQTKIETVYPTSGTGSATRELVGNTILLGSGSKGTNKYRVRLLYDFKTNKLTSAFIPSETIDATINLNTDYLYARVGEGSSTQLSFSEDGALNNVKKAYAAFEFPKDQMVGFMPDWTSNDYRARRYCRYYFSLPFAVRICDIFGVGEYGNQYIIQKYNGEKRAEIGWFQDTDTFWETLGDNEELEPNRGYALMLDREAFNDGSNGVWTNIQAGGSTFLYFPSKENVNTISGSTGSYPIVEHRHTSNRVNSKTGEKHSDTDSNWAMIGANAYGDVYTQAGGRPAGRYEYNPATNGWTLNAGDKTDVYKSLHAYMVQWAGTFQWQTTTPASVAARQKDVVKNNTIQLNLIQNDEVSDKTFVKLNNEASTEFVLNEDVCKIINSGVPNIYTYAGVYDVALSQVPEENQIVSVGVVIRKNGTYTFSMPENINGTVTLIDEFEQTRTNLSLSDYEVTLPKGTTNDRFKLEINVKKIPTAIDGVEGEGTLKDGKAHKFLQNGVMYILQNGCLYDAQGRRVE